MEPFKLEACLGVVKLWSGRNEARFRPFLTKITRLKSISRDLSNGSISIGGMFGDSETLEWSKKGEMLSV